MAKLNNFYIQIIIGILLAIVGYISVDTVIQMRVNDASVRSDVERLGDKLNARIDRNELRIHDVEKLVYIKEARN